MNPDNKNLLTALDKMEWFESVGKPILNRSVPRVTSWKEAMDLCLSKGQKNVALEGKNILTEKLCFEFPKRYHGKWNTFVLEIKKTLLPLSEKKTKTVIKANKLPKGFLDAVQWDILMGCMELEYADLVSPRFFKERVDWYLAGHFPCGWEGNFPEGKLIVF